MQGKIWAFSSSFPQFQLKIFVGMMKITGSGKECLSGWETSPNEGLVNVKHAELLLVLFTWTQSYSLSISHLVAQPACQDRHVKKTDYYQQQMLGVPNHWLVRGRRWLVHKRPLAEQENPLYKFSWSCVSTSETVGVIFTFESFPSCAPMWTFD